MGFIADRLRAKRAKEYSKDDKQRAKRERAAAEGKQKEYYDAEKAGKFDAQVSQAQRDLAQASKKRTDTSGIAASQAMQLSALSSDPRALAAGVAGVTQQANVAKEQAAQSDMKTELAAESKLAGLEDAALAENVGLDVKLAGRKLVGAETDELMAQQNLRAAQMRGRAADDAKFEANVALGESLADTGLGLLDGGSAEKGAKVKKTPGSFSHKSNPIDIVRQGAKIGEMTGGEYIINPAQAKKIDDAQQAISKKKNITERDLKQLYKAVRSVFNQPQFD